MFKKLFLSATVSLVFAATSVWAEDLNQPQQHRSTINQQQINQVGQPLDNQIGSLSPSSTSPSYPDSTSPDDVYPDTMTP